MKKNVGGIDQQIRFGLGAILLLGGILAPIDPGWRIGLFVVAAIAMVTAFTGL